MAKILLTGVPGTGKTTTLENLKHKLKLHGIILPEFIKENNYNNNKVMSILKEKKELLESFVESVTGDDANVLPGKSALDKDVAELLLSDLETKMLEIL